ncbi:MAG: type II toxin-antitoxin system VapC family toxin [Caulobacteraceae bacterium]|nr:type II toxin-antitoxin system VapC family toxin [Caulobacteraceae bacterium]
MILLDTNVVSEIIRPAPAPSVEQWLAAQSPAEVFICATTEAELRYGVALMAEGRRRFVLAADIERMLASVFAGRILAFDSAAAVEFAVVASDRRRAGRPIGISDAQIAAIARSRGATLATRNLDDFAGCGVEIVNPWRASP